MKRLTPNIAVKNVAQTVHYYVKNLQKGAGTFSSRAEN